MSTIINDPNPKFSPGPTPQPNRTPLLLGIIAVLLIGLIGLGIAYVSRGTENAELSADYTEMEQFKLASEKQYYESIAELEEMRGSNEELNALIDQQKEELRTQKDKIEGLTRDSRNLGAARSELANMKTQVQSYVIEIEDLRLANAALAENNQRLTSERDVLTTDLTDSRQQNESLSSERAVLVTERERLTSNNQELSRKVGIASVLKANNINVVGQKERNNGKWVNRNTARNVERINVCFNSLDNAVAQAGEEAFQVRLINPTGETIQIDADGSGVFTSTESGDRIPYTTQVMFDFDGSANSHCANWAVGNQEFQKGTYVAELYNKGFFVGTGTVVLK
ncbi:hypothetical protein [Neolewinella antarctica]|uniref:Nucleic acid-binding Zn-ribbon protein n=1 Tax=Neolewinella antarctica TaxID=442734 RepID=A0ABX0XAN6_9BACT|nr:hypothetical protein [Neolewinella antarctica]NJC25862.1 putative nucleic acid-binding Zn-ribbon protein [Neolewinella antarctica]